MSANHLHDIMVSSILHTETAQPAVGRVYVFLLPDYSGGWPSSTDKEWTADLANIIIDGPTGDNYVNFGYAMACNGNTNKGTGEGRDSSSDLSVGAPRGNNCDYTPDTREDDRGFAYLYRFSDDLSPGENGDHELWEAIADSAAYYRIHCDYQRLRPWLGRSISFIGDLNDDADEDDEILIGCPGWDTVTPPDEDDRGGVYLILH